MTMKTTSFEFEVKQERKREPLKWNKAMKAKEKLF